jgi:phosphatidate cytidylyltransferase
MLFQRVLTASVLLAVMLLPLFLLGSVGEIVFLIFLSTLASIAVFEWMKITAYSQKISLVVATLTWCVLLGIVFVDVLTFLFSTNWFLLLVVLSLWGMVIFLRHPSQTSKKITMLISIVWVIAAVTVAKTLVVDRHSVLMLFSLMMFVWIADSAAYFIGRSWGKYKMAPSISPNKTWEGAAGAFVFVFIFHVMAAFFWPVSFSANLFHRWGFFSFVLIFLILVFSIVGDLFESKLKRMAGVKDSGRILPGHGGILDRVDALLPVLAFSILVI